MKKKILALDLDNTLIDADKAHTIAYNWALIKMNRKRRKNSFIHSLLGKPKEEVAKAILNSRDKKLIKKLNWYHDKYLVNETYKSAKRFPYVIRTLKKLKKRYKLALLSNCKHRNIIMLLKGAKIDKRLFDDIVGSDDVRHSKPWPDEILKIKKKGEIEFMIGDSIYDIVAAKKAKVKSIAVLSGHYTRKRLKEKNPDFIIKSINDTFKIID